MKTKNILLVTIITAIIIIVLYSFRSGSGDQEYHLRITKEREEIDRFMKTSAESPIPDKAGFQGLKYFPTDAKYRVVADLSPIEDKKTVTLSTSDGVEQRYVEYAYAEFTLDGKENKLLILESVDSNAKKGTLFLAFADATSASETYGAGRYLDVTKTPGASTITLDFNKAYNPYCAYNDTYSCPFPPAENILAIPIRAGEKNYH
jgi:uncharacterized protein